MFLHHDVLKPVAQLVKVADIKLTAKNNVVKQGYI